MAWNGSLKTPTDARSQVSTRTPAQTARRWIFFSVLLAASALALLYLFLAPDREKTSLPSPRNESVPQRIAEVEAQIPPTKVEPEERPAKPAPRPPQRVGEVRDGKLLMLSGELRAVKGVITSCVQTVSVAEKTFKHTADRRIASLLRVQAGEGILGSSEELFANFKEQFEESLKEEIVFSPDDTDEQRELKQAVLDARKELLACRARGEDVAKIMIDTRNQLQELGAYRDDLERQVEKLREDGDFSEQDEDDLVRAANTMLQERGVKPLELPSVIKHALELERLNEEGESTNE